MLIFDSELSFIPAEEPEPAEVYRSTASGEESLSCCEAYVCLIAREGKNRVYAALHVKDIKRNLIYFIDEPFSLESMKKALAFVENMGFTMEPVKLKYGKAMREVVLRSVPVLLASESIDLMRKEKETELAELMKLVSEAEDEAEAGPAEADPEKEAEAKKERAERRNAASAAARKLALEKSAEEKAAAIGEAVRKFLFQANASELADAEQAERERLRGEVSGLEKRAADLEKTLVRLRKEQETERADARKRIAELETEVRKITEEARSSRAEEKGLEKEKEAGRQLIAELEQALREARQEIAEEKGRGKALAEGKEAAQKEVKDLKQTLSEAVCQTQEKSEGAGEDAAALARAEERIALLERELGEARETVEAERFERELLVREKAAALRRLEERGQESNEAAESSGRNGDFSEMERRLADATGSSDRLREELEEERAERRKLEAELCRLQAALRDSKQDVAADDKTSELRQALRRAEERTEILRMEVERLAAAKADAERRLAEGEQVPRKEAAPRSAGTSANPVSTDPVPPPHVVRRPPPKGAFFHADWDLEMIEYGAPADVLDAYESMNMAQISLEGYHTQHCSAWIVGLQRGKNRQVHIAFGLSESRRNLIYSPAKAIRTGDDYRRAMNEAVKFLEVVGYLPEKISLGKSPGNALSRIPVLQGAPKKAQGF